MEGVLAGLFSKFLAFFSLSNQYNLTMGRYLFIRYDKKVSLVKFGTYIVHMQLYSSVTINLTVNGKKQSLIWLSLKHIILICPKLVLHVLLIQLLYKYGNILTCTLSITNTGIIFGEIWRFLLIFLLDFQIVLYNIEKSHKISYKSRNFPTEITTQNYHNYVHCTSCINKHVSIHYILQ